MIIYKYIISSNRKKISKIDKILKTKLEFL